MFTCFISSKQVRNTKHYIFSVLRDPLQPVSADLASIIELIGKLEFPTMSTVAS